MCAVILLLQNLSGKEFVQANATERLAFILDQGSVVDDYGQMLLILACALTLAVPWANLR